MTLSTQGLVVAVVFLALGVVELFVFMQAVYPVISKRHEAQKVTQAQGRSPDLITNIVRLQCLVAMPFIGYYVGSQFITSGVN